MSHQKKVAARGECPAWIILATCLVVTALLSHFWIKDQSLFQRNGDMLQYQRTAVAFLVGTHEDPSLRYYPPLASIVFVTALLNPFGLSFHLGLHLTMLLWTLLSAWFIRAWLRPEDKRWWLLSLLLSITLLEPSVFFARFDLFPTLMILLGCLSFRRELYHHAGGFLMAGILLKFSPIFLVPLFYVLTPKAKRTSLLIGMGIVALGVAAIATLIAGTRWVTPLLGFGILRGGHLPYALSTVSSIDLFVRMLLGGTADIRWIGPNIGHFNFGLPKVLSVFLLLLTTVFSLGIARLAVIRRSPPNVILRYACSVMLGVLFLTPLLTMHYYLWVLPLVFLVSLESWEQQGRSMRMIVIITLATLIALLGQYFYPHAYFDLVDRQTSMTVTLNLARNILVLVLCLLMLPTARERS